MVEFQTTVMNGFPVLVQADCEHTVFCSVRTGKPLGEWIVKKLEASGEIYEIEAEINQELLYG